MSRKNKQDTSLHKKIEGRANDSGDQARSQPGERSPQLYESVDGGKAILRKIRCQNGQLRVTRIDLATNLGRKKAKSDPLADLADLSYLRMEHAPRISGKSSEVRTVDLFSGCGFMSLGVQEACRALGKRFAPILAVDLNPSVLHVYEENFSPRSTVAAQLQKFLDRPLGKKRSNTEKTFLRGLGRIDVLLGGPPCQGHSDLNNHTRRKDPKNRLYDRMARFAELVRPKHIVIENVPTAIHDRQRIVQKTIKHLSKLGYNVDSGLVEVSRLGVPQGRRRHLVVASLTKKINIEETVARYETAARTTGWALSDLLDRNTPSLFDTPSKPTPQNKKRIDYLFKHRVFNLPNFMRPKCHRKGGHSYNSVYGRLRWDRPAQTITTGFNCMGQGRFVHPRRRRTITPHEAARLQFIPDFFRFDGVDSRTALAEMIGNAVPPKLTYIFALELLR